VTIGEGWNVDRPVNRELHLFTTTDRYSARITADAAPIRQRQAAEMCKSLNVLLLLIDFSFNLNKVMTSE